MCWVHMKLRVFFASSPFPLCDLCVLETNFLLPKRQKNNLGVNIRITCRNQIQLSAKAIHDSERKKSEQASVVSCTLVFNVSNSAFDSIFSYSLIWIYFYITILQLLRLWSTCINGGTRTDNWLAGWLTNFSAVSASMYGLRCWQHSSLFSFNSVVSVFSKRCSAKNHNL